MTATGEHPEEIEAPPTTDLPAARALRDNLLAVRARIERAADRAGRPAPELVAVTKTVSNEIAQALVDLGCRDLGENRARALESKHAAVRSPRPRWHFIGHLQRNKAKRVVERVDVLHSVDSLRLARAVLGHAEERVAHPLATYVEVNLTGEKEKHGFAAGEARDAVELLANRPGVDLLGIMAMGPLSRRDTRSVDAVFAEARDLADELTASHEEAFEGGRCRLSMGMSGDFEEAIRFGSDCVRVGSALFEGLGS